MAGLKKPSGDGSHKADIEGILASLDIDPSDPVATKWLEMPTSEDALHAIAHRKGLGVRTDMSVYMSAWDIFQAILALVLDRLEATSLRAFAEIDRIVDDPSPGSLATLRSSMPQNHVTLSYFFEKAGADWIETLRGSEYLIPDPTPDDDGGYLPWPAARWVVRVGIADPAFGEEMIAVLDGSPNPAGAIAGLDLLMGFPPALAVSRTTSAIKWIGVGGAGARDRGADLALRMHGEEYDEAAIEITKVVLGTGPS